MQTHLALRTLRGTQKPDRDVQVLFATEPDQRVVLFIHGFNGDAVKTWADFHELLPGCPKCACRDLIFYGYDGLRANLNASAAIFRVFLNRLFAKPCALLSENLPASAARPCDFAYTDLVIVGHSLGAVIARRALLDATRMNCEWLGRTKLVLYAPAHKGARITDLALEAASSFSFLKLFGVGARFQSPLLEELRPESRVLKQLLADTREALQTRSNAHLVATKVILAEYETVVENETFGDDPPPETIPDTTHTSVCKPTKLLPLPLTALEECL